MEKLSFQTLESQGYEGYVLKDAPERVLQFGEGNFLRAFVDYWFDILNEKGGFHGKVVVVTPISPPKSFDAVKLINEQDGLYTLYLRGMQDGKKVEQKRIISSISRCLNPYADFQAFLQCAKNPDLQFIVSNTTEAGIVYDPGTAYDQEPPHSFPGKMTRLLHERWKAGLPGLTILACELIDRNGEELRKIILRHIQEWGLESDFYMWVETQNTFCSSLVDRIVPGYPRQDADRLTAESNYEDALMDTGEIFGFWVIEGPERIAEALHIKEAGLEDKVIVVPDHTPYKQRKVRILNGAHTSFVPGAYLSGQDIVRDCMADEGIKTFMNTCIYQEIIPTLTLPKENLLQFADSVVDRFGNPFIDHRLLDICLNSTSKWRARVLPSVKAYVEKFKKLPSCLTASFACYLAFYRGSELTDEGLMGTRGEERYTIKDDRGVLEFFFARRNDSPEAYVDAVCGNETFWGEDLRAIPGFADAVIQNLRDIDAHGTHWVMERAVSLTQDY